MNVAGRWVRNISKYHTYILVILLSNDIYVKKGHVSSTQRTRDKNTILTSTLPSDLIGTKTDLIPKDTVF